MKGNSPGRRTDYTKILRRLYLYILASVAAAVVFVALARQLVRGVLGDAIVSFFTWSFRLEHRDAMAVYQLAIRNNIDVFIAIAILICFLLLCRIMLSSFVRYFDELNAGIDMLIRDDGEPIVMSYELDFIEQKLNVLRQTLEKRQLEAKLAEERKNDLVIYLAHDVKTPLTSVIGYLSLLNEAPDIPAQQREKYLRIALDKAYRLERLTDEFFEIARYNTGGILLSKEDIDLPLMLLQLVDEFYPLICERDNHIAIDAPDELTIYGDPDKLARAFNNILKNAIAYSPHGSIIDLEVSVSDCIVSFVFTNDGVVPNDKLEAIFDKFYRLDSARPSGTGGAGLGLAVAREIITKHGGRVYADSGNERTSITVELPAKEGAVAKLVL